MIYTDRQYSITSSQLAKLENALSATKRKDFDQAWLKASRN